MADTKKYVSLDKLGLYDEKIKGVISAGDAAALQSAKDYADGLASNYEVAGAAATAKSEAIAAAKTETETQVKALADGAVKANTDAIAAIKDDANVDSFADVVAELAKKQDSGDYATKSEAQGYANAKDEAIAAAQGAADAAQADVDALETYVGTFTHDTAKSVVEYINAKTDGIATSGNLEALGARVTTVEGKVATIEGDYLKAADKEELQGNIDTVSGAVERLTNGVSAEEIDGVNDLIQYVKDHGTEVTGMQGDIADNASAIEGVAGRMTTADDEIDALQGAVATKVEQSAYDEKVAALEGADTTLSGRIDTLEGKFGGAEGSVEDMIADAKAEAISEAGTAADTKDEAVLAAAKKYADDEDAQIESRVDALETASGTHALASDVTALAGRVTTAEGEIDTLQSEMDAVEAKAAANESAIAQNAAAIALKAAQTDLEAVSGRVATLETWHANFTEVSEAEINALFQ